METVICFDGSRLFWQPSSLGTVICFYHLLSWKTHIMCESGSLLSLLYFSSSLPLHLLVFVSAKITCFRWKSCSVFSVCPATWPGWEAHCWLLTNVYKKFYCENSEKKGTNDQIETKSTVLNFKTFWWIWRKPLSRHSRSRCQYRRGNRCTWQRYILFVNQTISFQRQNPPPHSGIWPHWFREFMKAC